MNNELNIAVVIVNWNGQHLLEECLQSLDKQTYKNFEIILVANGSTDNSVDFVQENFPKVKIIELTENTGFAKGNNIGISQALENKKIENIILLNNDTKAKEDFIEKLIGANNDNNLNKKYKKIGALAPKMLLLQQNNASESIDAIGTRTSLDGRGYNIGNGKIDNGQYDKFQEVFGFCGGAVLLRRKMFEEVGLFDDIFFAYYEDSDLSWRMRLQGWQVVTVPTAVIWHMHSATAEPFSFFKAYYLNRNRFLMMLKNYPWEFLWRGLLRVPVSYLKFSRTARGKKYIQGGGQSTGLKKQLLRKIKMVWVMMKVASNIFAKGSNIIKQRKLIQENMVVKKSKLKKWLIQKK